MQWGRQQKLAVAAIIAGDFQSAVDHLKRDRFQNTILGQRVARRLTSALVERAEHCTAAGNLHQAWIDLTLASSVSVLVDSDALSRKKNELVELTVESAESFLSQGQATHTLRVINELNNRRILDWRADRLTETAILLKEAEESAAIGRFANEIQQLEQARELHPQLSFIEARLAVSRHRQMQVRELTSALQHKIVKEDWDEVQLCCQKLLTIAPKYEIALDAQKHCLAQMRGEPKLLSQLSHTSGKRKGDSFFQIGPGRYVANYVDDDSENAASLANSFLLWVDGAGGFLVCSASKNVIGQAVPDADISIPIVGDLRKRHAKLLTVDDQHFLNYLDTEGGTGRPKQDLVQLRNGQQLGFDGGVKLKYTKPHPLSSTARIDFVSRHRTQPWSDAILLAGQSIILGPDPNNHVYCPTWNHDLILFRRHNNWYCRSKNKIDIDGEQFDFEGPITMNSTVSGEDFSLTLEPAFDRSRTTQLGSPHG